MVNDFNIIVFISGRGSNLAGLVNSQENFRILAVISNNPHAAGLEIASKHAIPTYAFQKSDYSSLAEMKVAIRKKAIELNPNLIALAGYMQIIEPDFIESFPGPIVNIHPSLLPKFPGLDTHARALKSKEIEHGCTVHLVDQGVDTGQILAQAKVKVENGDTPETLGARVLEREHVLYPWVINCIAKQAIKLGPEGLLRFSEVAKEQAHEFNFVLTEGA